MLKLMFKKNIALFEKFKMHDIFVENNGETNDNGKIKNKNLN